MMATTIWHKLFVLRKKISLVLIGPQALAFIPAVVLAAFWLGGEAYLIATAVLLPVFYVLIGGFSFTQKSLTQSTAQPKELLDRKAFEHHVDETRAETMDKSCDSVLMYLEIDDYSSLKEHHGQAAADEVMQRTCERIITVLRKQDVITRIDDSRFALCLKPTGNMDLEICIQLAARLQTTIEEPVTLDGISIYTMIAIGFCLSSRAPGANGADWQQAASLALSEARKRGPSTIRAFSDGMLQKKRTNHMLCDEVRDALETGQITPWYQPQVSTNTGLVTGFEALARWHHPVHGLVSPADFLPALEQAGLMERLADVIMHHSFTALKAWESAGVHVPRVGVNFSGAELNNPSLIHKIQWELDRFELTPDRLSIEILETVIAGSPDDQITRNINGLVALGCMVDLDDFGTGHASISSIRRFRVNRLKIDRSFVTKADRDPEQQRMIGAILTMAERLSLETVAEGVETAGEHALLAQLGCDHVQGFGIGKPMPFDKTFEWLHSHMAKLKDVPQIPSRGTK